ncbi:MAG TPA: hypothetical protein VF166_07180 [Gemmatimonadaceae bacterium]
MMDVNAYGVVALEENALMAIDGGGDGCKELAYAIGYAIGWVVGTVIEAGNEVQPWNIPY